MLTYDWTKNGGQVIATFQYDPLKQQAPVATSPRPSERTAHVFMLVVYMGILAQTHSHVAGSLAGMTQCKSHV